MMTERLAQPQSMHRRAQRAPIRTLFGPGTEARKPLSWTAVLLVTRGNGLFRRAATGEYVVQIKAIRGTAQPGCETGLQGKPYAQLKTLARYGGIGSSGDGSKAGRRWPLGRIVLLR